MGPVTALNPGTWLVIQNGGQDDRHLGFRVIEST